MTRDLKTPFATPRVPDVAHCLLLCVAPSLSQKSDAAPPPKYDSQTETKTKGTIDEIKTITVGSRKDFTEAVLKAGDTTLQIYLCPKSFQDEMGVTFAKGDEIAVTGSKVKQEDAVVILAREVIKGNDSLLLRDDKGKPIWDERTGK